MTSCKAIAPLTDSMTEHESITWTTAHQGLYAPCGACEHLPRHPRASWIPVAVRPAAPVDWRASGYDVTLFDLSTGNLTLAREKAAEAGVTLAGFEQGTALDLARFADHSFDAVLLMGPLYHLLEAADRRRALTEARRVLKPSGPLFVAFITRYAAHRDAAVHYPDRAGGSARPLRTDRGRRRTAAYEIRRSNLHRRFCPTGGSCAALHREAGLEVDHRVGHRRIGQRRIEDQVVNGLTGPAWDWWTEANWRAARDPRRHGAGVASVGGGAQPALAARPACRSPAGWIKPNVYYTVVGGACSLALHGLPLPVNDLDIETDPAGAAPLCCAVPGAHGRAGSR